MERYLANAEWGGCDAMKTLMTEKDLNGVTEILANIAMAFLLKDKQEVVPEDEQTLLRVKDENAVADAIADYASFVCQYNPSFKEADFGWLYEAGWRQYFKYLESRLDDYAFDGSAWKKNWELSFLSEKPEVLLLPNPVNDSCPTSKRQCSFWTKEWTSPDRRQAMPQ